MGRGRAKAGVSGGLGCARPGHVRAKGGQSSERVRAQKPTKFATNKPQPLARAHLLSHLARLSIGSADGHNPNKIRDRASSKS